MTGDRPNMVHFGPKMAKQAGLSAFQSGPKGSKMVNLDVLVLKISRKHNLIACRNSLNGDYNNRKHYLPLS